jgi:hypothetical protein
MGGTSYCEAIIFNILCTYLINCEVVRRTDDGYSLHFEISSCNLSFSSRELKFMLTNAAMSVLRNAWCYFDVASHK